MNATINVKPETQKLLKKLSIARGKSMRVIVERALDLYIVSTEPLDEIFQLLKERIREALLKEVIEALTTATIEGLETVMRDLQAKQKYKPWSRGDGLEEDDDLELLGEGEGEEDDLSHDT